MIHSQKKILAIETSCDETAIAVYSYTHEVWHGRLTANEVFSQYTLHAPYHGVVPELAARDHAQRLPAMIDETLQKCNCSLAQISHISYTAGPGLIVALLTGSAFATSLAWSLAIPAIPTHHLEAHVLAAFIHASPPVFPFISLLVSGGHTQFILVKSLGDYTIIGDTLDDAAGEAFDKTATMLGLGYPGGAALAKLAATGNPTAFNFPRPMRHSNNGDMSFSGLKTAARYAIQALSDVQLAQLRVDIAASIEAAIVDILTLKARFICAKHNIHRLVVGGGVSANLRLRQRLSAEKQLDVVFPDQAFCNDNAAMIAFTAALRLEHGIAKQSTTIQAMPRWSVDELRHTSFN